jgi:hypothetical protein
MKFDPDLDIGIHTRIEHRHFESPCFEARSKKPEANLRLEVEMEARKGQKRPAGAESDDGGGHHTPAAARHRGDSVPNVVPPTSVEVSQHAVREAQHIPLALSSQARKPAECVCACM